MKKEMNNMWDSESTWNICSVRLGLPVLPINIVFEACPVQVYQWSRSEQDVPGIEMTNTTSQGTGEDRNRDRKKRLYR